MCTQYFEILNEGNCWDITDNLRKTMYKLLLMRNYNSFGKNIKNEKLTKTIIEYKRRKIEIEKLNGNDSSTSSGNSSDNDSSNDSSNDYEYASENKHEFYPNEINIEINKNECIPLDIDKRFNLYLDIFDCNTKYIKSLPYYLIPLVTSLRYYLNEKMKKNHFIPINDINDLNSNITIDKIYDFEFDALVASSIAALTLTYLNINVDQNNKTVLFKNRQRLELQRKLNKNQILELMKDQSSNFRFKRQTQFLAEFRNVLTINSNIMQILKLTDDHPELQNIVTMHHYIWEEAYHRIVYQINKKFINHSVSNITTLFKNLFYIDGINIKDEKFNSYMVNLNKNYHWVLNTVKQSKFKSKI